MQQTPRGKDLRPLYTAMVAEGSQELITTKKKKKNSPPARELKTVDPMNDDGIWCVLDTACKAGPSTLWAVRRVAFEEL